jgi:allantoinase
MGFHPHVIGQPYRISTLDRILTYMQSREKVWFATREEIADWYREHYLA